MTTGDRIRQLRIEHQMTQEELGAKVGVQKAAIYKYENGLVVNLKRSVLEKLALVLDTTPTYLMGMEESEHNPSTLTPQQSALLASFDQLNEEGQTILMVTHSAQAASHASRVLFIKDGEVFHQIYKGSKSCQEMYQMIADTLTILTTGGEQHA